MKHLSLIMTGAVTGLLLIVSCVAPPPPRATTQTATLVVTPTVPLTPIELQELPKTGWILIYSLDSGMSAFVWEHLGLPGSDPSYPKSDRGKELGHVNEGDEVTVLDYAWSVADANYQVLIKKGSLEGWIDFDVITFEKPQ